MSMRAMLLVITFSVLIGASASADVHVFLNKKGDGHEVLVAVQYPATANDQIAEMPRDLHSLALRGVLSAFCNGQELTASNRKDGSAQEDYDGATFDRYWSDTDSVQELFDSKCREGSLAIVLSYAGIGVSKTFDNMDSAPNDECVDIEFSSGSGLEVTVINRYKAPVFIDPIDFLAVFSDGSTERIVSNSMGEENIVLEQIDLLVPGELSVFALPNTVSGKGVKSVCYMGLLSCQSHTACS